MFPCKEVEDEDDSTVNDNNEIMKEQFDCKEDEDETVNSYNIFFMNVVFVNWHLKGNRTGMSHLNT